MVSKLLSFGIRAGIAGGFIYWTKEQGVWGNAQQATECYNKIYIGTSRLLKDVPVELPDVPKPHEVTTFLHVNWNKAVYAAFDGLRAAPRKICEWSCKGWQAAIKMINEPPKAETAQ